MLDTSLFQSTLASLPIAAVLEELREKLQNNPIIVLQAPPGAGKSTTLPLALLNESWLNNQNMLMLEPRRLAARSVAQRMADLIFEEPGDTIGYRMRFEHKVSNKTRIEVLTEGILTRRLQNDTALEGTGLVIFDEFHERSLNADLGLALCRQVQELLRPDLRILVMSATLDSEKLSAQLGNAPVVKCEGRQFPVSIHYLGDDTSLPLVNQVTKAIQKAAQQQHGDLLVFLPGSGEIHRVAEALAMSAPQLSVFPLYADLPFQQQQAAIQPGKRGERKVVLATSIAETSLTIEGISIVVDSGYSRVPRFDPRTGLTRLETVKVTRDAADQRAGRAGRLGPGHCYRLWAEGTHLHLQAQRVPEIMEADLAPLMLELFQWGIKDVQELGWITAPPAGAVNQATELLEQLEAISNRRISEKGKKMLKLPSHPRIAHMLLMAQDEDAQQKKNTLSALACDITAVLEEKDALERQAGTDISRRIEELRNWRRKEYTAANRRTLERIERLSATWRKIIHVDKQDESAIPEDVGKLVAAAYPERIARRLEHRQGLYRMANGRMAKISMEDPLSNEEWLSIAQVEGGGKEGRIFSAAPLDPDDIKIYAQQKEHLRWDGEKGIIVSTLDTYIGHITLESKPSPQIPEDKKRSLLCEVIRQEGWMLLNRTEETANWQNRILSLGAWRKEMEWPDVSDQNLLQTVEVWLAPYLEKVSKKTELKQLPLLDILKTLLPWELQQKAEQLAPEKLLVPSGSWIPIRYFADGSLPELSVRLQEVFGLAETPTVNDGRTKIRMHLLSPGFKPVQVTQDLKSFWDNTYPEVRKEFRIRYAKHSWPEDPWTAEAVRGAKRRNIG